MSDHDPDTDPGPTPLPNMVLVASLFEGGLVLVAVGLGWVFGIAPLASTRADGDALAVGVIATTPMLVLLWWGLTRPDGAVGQVTRQAGDLVGQAFATTSVPGLLLISLLAGLGEEALFRGLLQPLIGGASNELVGLVAASVLFGLAHALSRAYAAVATVIGLYLGALFIYTDNLMVPIVTHALYDFVALWWLRNQARSV